MRFRSPATSSRTFLRSTAAAVRARRCSCGMASATNSSRTCWARAWSGTGLGPASATSRDRWSTSRLIATRFARNQTPTLRQAQRAGFLPKPGRSAALPALSFRFMEPLEEAVYLDQVRLLAVDHPADVDVYPNEYFASNPPYPPFKVVVSRDARPPAGAWDEHGHDVLPDLLAHRYFGDFALTQFSGIRQAAHPDARSG